jgi:hypothetical protein
MEKKTYEKPAIICERQIETLAAFCDSTWFGQEPCMKPGCDQPGA